MCLSYTGFWFELPILVAAAYDFINVDVFAFTVVPFLICFVAAIPCLKCLCRSCEKEIDRETPYYNAYFRTGPLGIKFNMHPDIKECLVNHVEPGSQAKKAKVRVNDKVLTVGRIKVSNAPTAMAEIKKQDRPILITFFRQSLAEKNQPQKVRKEDLNIFTTVFGWAIESYKQPTHPFLRHRQQCKTGQVVLLPIQLQLRRCLVFQSDRTVGASNQGILPSCGQRCLWHQFEQQHCAGPVRSKKRQQVRD